MSEIEKLIQLERQLHDPEVRNNPEQVKALLAQDFFEFGASGKRWEREHFLSKPASQKSDKIQSSNFEGRELAQGLVLLTYKTTSEREYGNVSALRSSLWKKIGNNWQMIFHQGTKTLF